MSLHFRHLRDATLNRLNILVDTFPGPIPGYIVTAMVGITVALKASVAGGAPAIYVVITVALAGFAVGHRWTDAALFAIAHLAIAGYFDAEIGPAALGVITLTFLAILGRPRQAVLLGTTVIGCFIGAAKLMGFTPDTLNSKQGLLFFFEKIFTADGVFLSGHLLSLALIAGPSAIVFLFVIVFLISFLVDEGRLINDRPLARAITCFFWPHACWHPSSLRPNRSPCK